MKQYYLFIEMQMSRFALRMLIAEAHFLSIYISKSSVSVQKGRFPGLGHQRQRLLPEAHEHINLRHVQVRARREAPVEAVQQMGQHERHQGVAQMRRRAHAATHSERNQLVKALPGHVIHLRMLQEPDASNPVKLHQNGNKLKKIPHYFH